VSKDDKKDEVSNNDNPEILENAEYEKIGVFWYCDMDKVNGETMRRVQLLATSDSLNLSRAILIVKDQTALAKKEEKDMLIELEVFTLDDIQVNITEHCLVPKHSVLTDDEKHNLMKFYRIKEHQLPKIQTSDPIAKYFGVKRNQVMKIIRSSETAGRYITYRIAI